MPRPTCWRRFNTAPWTTTCSTERRRSLRFFSACQRRTPLATFTVRLGPCPHRLAVRTDPSHGSDRGSIPHEGTSYGGSGISRERKGDRRSPFSALPHLGNTGKRVPPSRPTTATHGPLVGAKKPAPPGERPGQTPDPKVFTPSEPVDDPSKRQARGRDPRLLQVREHGPRRSVLRFRPQPRHGRNR